MPFYVSLSRVALVVVVTWPTPVLISSVSIGRLVANSLTEDTTEGHTGGILAALYKEE